MKSSRPLIITGMPRSGLRLVASAFFNAGLYLGGRVTPPRETGPSEHRVDASERDISSFHDELLGKNTLALFRAGPGAVNVPADFETRAKSLLHDVYGSSPAWGWRDARTVLLLDAWDRLLPDARWIFVVRSPSELAWSMLWHKDLADQITLPASRVRIALQFWVGVNRMIHSFVKTHPDRARLVFVPLDMETPAIESLNETVLRRWLLDVAPLDMANVYFPHMLKKKSPAWVRALAATYVPAQKAWTDLLALREVRSANARAASSTHSRIRSDGEPLHTVCVATTRKLAFPETFIRAHVQKLPARVEFVHGQDYPTLTSDELPLRSRWERFAEAHSKEFGMETNFFRQRALCRFLRNKGVDVVLAEFGPVGVTVMDACVYAGVPLVVHFHGYDASRQAVLEAHRETYPRMFGVAAGIIVVSQDMEKQLLALGAPRERLFCNPCGVDTDIFRGAQPDTVPPHFLSVGRFVEKKGPHLTLLAFQQVVRSCPDARLTMIGEGPLAGACEQMARAMNIKDRITFLGARPHIEIVAMMRTARCFVQHSLAGSDGNSEGTPVAISEAGASGLPVVSTRHAGIKESVLHGQTGFLVAEGDVEGMAAYMIQLAKQPELAAQMGARAREHICANYSMEKSIGRLWRILESCIRPGNGQ